MKQQWRNGLTKQTEPAEMQRKANAYKTRCEISWAYLAGVMLLSFGLHPILSVRTELIIMQFLYWVAEEIVQIWRTEVWGKQGVSVLGYRLLSSLINLAYIVVVWSDH